MNERSPRTVSQLAEEAKSNALQPLAKSAAELAWKYLMLSLT